MSAARAWAQRGHVAWILEWRSHGASAQALEAYDFETVALQDVSAALDWLRTQHPGQLLFAATHSGGGLALLMALLRHPELQALFKRIALFACQSHMAGRNPLRRWVLGAGHVLSRLYGGIPGPLLRLGVCEEAHSTLASWFQWNLRGQFVGKDGFDYSQQLPRLQVPTLCLAAPADHLIAPPSACEQFARQFTHPQSRYQLCGSRQGFGHRFGHGNLMHGQAAQQHVLPYAMNWLLS